jgi:flagellar basal-body rod modification protein FlgD
MSTSAVNNSGQSMSNDPSTISRTLNKELDRNAFLTLLITQMQSQDPMKPMEDREFIAELAQFSALEQQQNTTTALDSLATAMQMSAATGFIGHTVTAENPATGVETVGKVQAVTVENGAPKLVIGTYTLEPGWVSRVE